MHIFTLILAILCEAGWALCLKKAAGWTRPAWVFATLVLYALALLFLELASRRMEIGTAYAVWAGAGVVLISLGGAALLGESLSLGKLGCILLIAIGIVGLSLLDTTAARTSENDRATAVN